MGPKAGTVGRHNGTMEDTDQPKPNLPKVNTDQPRENADQQKINKVEQEANTDEPEANTDEPEVNTDQQVAYTDKRGAPENDPIANMSASSKYDNVTNFPQPRQQDYMGRNKDLNFSNLKLLGLNVTLTAEAKTVGKTDTGISQSPPTSSQQAPNTQNVTPSQ